MYKIDSLLKIFFSACLTFITVACNNNMNRLAEDFQSGVVLVQTTEYYEMKMSDGSSLYFTGSDFDKTTGEFIGLSIELNTLSPDIIYGTGFFISDDGKIATNRHVVEGNVKEHDVRNGMKKMYKSIENSLVSSKDLYAECRSETASDLANNPDTIEGLLKAQKDAYEYFSMKLNETNRMLSMMKENDPNDITLVYHNYVRIAYNNTFIHSSDEFKPCVIREKSETDDLAIIQLNTKQTPEGHHVFELSPSDMLEHYSFGEYLMRTIGEDKNKTLMMIGYNEGPVMALTEEGIVAQHQLGSITRNIGDEREIQYEIPALNGSSGSPVLNRRGQVVAVNYAGTDAGSNSFNYGVKGKYLYKLNKNI